MPERTFVVVGASLAGGTAAAILREEGFDGRVVLIGAEPHPPYERPPLSKEYLRGEQSFQDGFLRPPQWYAENRIECHFGVRAERIDPRGVVHLPGRTIEFDSALVASGSRNRRLSVPGADLPGVLDLRVVADSDLLRQAAERGGRAVVVGMGFIGSEVAASLRQLGVEVTAVHAGGTVLERVLGPDVGRVLEAVHRDHGVEVLLGDRAERFEGGDHVERVVTAKGRRIECDFAVVGVGVQPNVEVVAGTDVAVDDGILVDSKLETSVPGLFAAGDVASHDHPLFGRVRIEHFDNAIKMGQAAARNMLGRGEVFADPHWFWSDQYDVNLQMAGLAREGDRVVFRGDIENRAFSAFYLRDGVLVAAASVNRPRDVRRAMPLISARARPDEAKLRDADVDLRTLRPTE